MARECYGWAIYFPHADYISGTTIRRTRSEAIAAFIGTGVPRAWRFWRRKHGLRAVRVITIMQDDTP